MAVSRLRVAARIHPIHLDIGSRYSYRTAVTTPCEISCTRFSSDSHTSTSRACRRRESRQALSRIQMWRTNTAHKLSSLNASWRKQRFQPVVCRQLRNHVGGPHPRRVSQMRRISLIMENPAGNGCYRCNTVLSRGADTPVCCAMDELHHEIHLPGCLPYKLFSMGGRVTGQTCPSLHS